MPQIASFHDSAHLWYLNDKTSKIQIYATWSRALKRHSKPNLLLENSLSKCLPGKHVKAAKPRGHGEWAHSLSSPGPLVRTRSHLMCSVLWRSKLLPHFRQLYVSLLMFMCTWQHLALCSWCWVFKGSSDNSALKRSIKQHLVSFLFKMSHLPHLPHQALSPCGILL